MQQRLGEVYARARGNAVRMGQILAEEDALELPYSTLTRWVREAELRQGRRRSGEYHFAPGEEMQHDTSPHRVELAGKPVTAQCTGLTLAYSRRLFVQYYPRFTRFEAKHFLLQVSTVHGRHVPALRHRQHQRHAGLRRRARCGDRPRDGLFPIHVGSRECLIRFEKRS